MTNLLEMALISLSTFSHFDGIYLLTLEFLMVFSFSCKQQTLCSKPVAGGKQTLQYLGLRFLSNILDSTPA
jgi:hypothetical protein